MFPKANKTLGQHFLKDKNVIEAITSDFAQEAEVIIEVGPGPGVLTEKLAKIGKPFYAFELDKRFKEILKGHVEDGKLFFTDALHFEWNDFLEEKRLLDKKIWMVSNLPYQISSQLFVLFLQIEPIKYFTLMFQKEVAEKIIPPKDKKNTSGSLAILGQNYFDIKVLKKVPPGCFAPPPKVDSLVISGVRKKQSHFELSQFSQLENFLRHLYSQKRKQIGNLLRQKYPDYLKVLEKMQIPATSRAEALDHKQVLGLCDMLEVKNGD